MWKCSNAECGREMFENLNTTASALIFQDDKLLLVRRAFEPQKGKWDIPGGFCEYTEHPEESCRREMKEELGVEVELLGLQGVYAPTSYVYQGDEQWNCDLFYNARIISGEITPMDDVADYAWFSLDQLPAPDELAFDSARQVMDILRKR